MNAKRILCTGKIATGPIDWHISPLPVDDVGAAFNAPPTCSYFAHLMPTDGTLQAMIDDGEKASATFGKMLLAMVGGECLDDTAEYEDDILDREDWSRGGW